MKTAPPHSAVAPDFLSFYPLPDSSADVQRLKGISLALNVIAQAIANLENILHQNADQGQAGPFIVQDIKRNRKWIKRILKTVKIKSRFPLLGHPFILNMPGLQKLIVSFKKLTLDKIRLYPERSNLFSLPDILRKFKQKLHYNTEALYMMTVLYKSDYILFHRGNIEAAQEPGNIQPLVFYELFSFIRRYCIRLTSSLLPADSKQFYFKLFAFFLNHVKHICFLYTNTALFKAAEDFISIIDPVVQTKHVQSAANNLLFMRNELNKLLNNPHTLFQEEYACG
jgi:hypothetical protein